MRSKSPAEIIANYRRARERRFPFSWTDILMAAIVLAALILAGYLLVQKPELPEFLKLNTLTPTPECACAPTAAPENPTALAATATNRPAPASTAAFTETPVPSPTFSATAPPTETATPTETPSPTATPITTFDYTVQEGETLGTIADRFGFTVAEVMAVNPDLKDPSFIYVGQKIKIPVK
jgi:LysM repeat protein